MTVAALAAVPTVMLASSASAAAVTLVVNSTDWGGADAIPGDGTCATAAKVCTLRAAIEEANALGASTDITITVADTIPVGTKMTGTNPNADQALKMNRTALSFQDANGAIFEVKAPMTIDLGHRLVADASAGDQNESTVFYLNGPRINVYNADNVLSSGTSFLVGPQANGVVIDGSQDGTRGSVATTASYAPERFVLFREGAQNVTVQHYKVSGFYDSISEGGIFVFNSYASPYTAMKNIVIDDVDVLYSSSTNCGGSDGSGCRTRLTNFVGDSYQNASRVAIEGLTFKNMVVRNMTGQYAFAMNASTADSGTDGPNSPTITNLTMVDNQFLNNNAYGTGEDYAFITLPYGGKLKGTTTISRNVFTTPDLGDVAIYVNAASTPAGTNSTTPSNITISDNYFDGYASGDGGVRFFRTGLATFSHNRFGTRSGGSGTSSEETSSGASMFHNFDTTSNEKIGTWFPTGTAKLVTGETPAGALPVTQELADPTAPVCEATVAVQRPTTGIIPRNPVTLDVYWTTANDAELYLGSVSGVTGANATLSFLLPVGSQSADGGATSIMAVDATTGATATGSIRLQTQVEGGAQLESSQYSRTVALEKGNCKPALTINQAATQNDSTSARDLYFTVTSTMPLDPASLTASDIGLTATATGSTIDAGRLNPRVVSITPVPGSNGKAFDVVVRVDDSATVTATVAAESVVSTAGLANSNPASFTDNAITFDNPLQVSPPRFTLVTGEPHGKDYSILIAAGAPEPTADLEFTSTVTQPDGTPALTLSTTTPAISAGAMQSDPVTVTAAAGDVTANTPTTISATVRSEDPNYDGLVVPPVKPYLFATDPTIQIEKRAWVARPGTTFDQSSPASIEATGDPAPAGTRLTDRQTVCFVYTVSNTSQDDWSTSLKNVTVTDSDERLGTAGVIGTIAEIPQGGAPAKLSSCTALVAVDTTTTDVVPDDGE